MKKMACLIDQENKQFNEALSCFLSLYEKGEPVAYELGMLFGHSEASFIDHEKAFEYFNEAASLKHPEAFNMIGVYFEQEALETDDYDQAIRLYIEAVSYGSFAALKNLKKVLLKATETSNESELDNLTGVLLLDAAIKYHYGRDVEKNLNQALKLYETSSTYENTTAMVNLSFIYMIDETVLDHKKAFEYALKAAFLGNSTAMNNVGWSYHKGLGVSLDIEQAVLWYERASSLNNAESMYSLGTIYEEGFLEGGLKVAETWYKKAAKLEHPKAKAKMSKKN